MKLFTAALLVVFCAEAVLARPEESASPVGQPATLSEQPKEPEMQPNAPALQPVEPVPEPAAPSQKPSKPVHKPTKPGSIIESILSQVKELIGKISHALTHGKGTATRATGTLVEKKKKTIAKIDTLKAQLQAKDKATVVPASPKDKRDAALAVKNAIKKAIQELDTMRAEIMKLK